MKKMFRMAALLLPLCLILSGCGGNSGGDTTKTTDGGTTGTTVAAPTVDATVVDLTAYFNKDAFSYCANPSDGNFDGLEAAEGEACYRADGISVDQIYEGVPYKLGPLEDGKKNCIGAAGQTITIEEPTACTFVGILGAATNGDYGDDFTITYADGSTEDIFVYMIDWCDISADYPVISVDHRHQDFNGDWEETAENNRTEFPPFVALYKMEVESTKQVKSITLPNERNINVLAMSLVKE